jgi:hypothetical protein
VQCAQNAGGCETLHAPKAVVVKGTGPWNPLQNMFDRIVDDFKNCHCQNLACLTVHLFLRVGVSDEAFVPREDVGVQRLHQPRHLGWHETQPNAETMRRSKRQLVQMYTACV